MTQIHDPLDRVQNPLRFRKARDDARVGYLERLIERLLGLPKGSVIIVLPSGRKARSDCSIRRLRASWS